MLVSRCSAAFACALLALLVAGGSAVAQQAQTGIELSAPTQRALKKLTEHAIQWNRAFLQDDRQAAERELEGSLAVRDQLGMSALPDLAAAALARAVEAARADEVDRALWTLDMAERLDPGRPETAFARAVVERSRGSYGKSVGALVDGYLRMFRFTNERNLVLTNLALWALVTLLAAAAFYLLLMIALRGQAVALDLIDGLKRFLPPAAAITFTGVLLVGPLLLPFGLFWLLLVWSLLLWGYTSLQERLVLVFIWMLSGLAPMAAAARIEETAVTASPAFRAVHAVREGRLYGRLLADLGALKSILPASRAVQHLEADFHARLGQWEMARPIYVGLAAAEPKNAAVRNDLGVYFFLNNDSGGATQSFEAATRANPNLAVPFFNLNQAYSSAYLYQEARAAISEAQRIDSERVGQWLRETEEQPVRALSGGFDRSAEIQAELLATRRSSDETMSPQLEVVRQRLSLLVGGLLVLFALALHLARRGFGYSSAEAGVFDEDTESGRLLRVLVPGLYSASEGRGIAAYLAFLPVVGLILLPLSGRWGVRIPWGFEPGGTWPWLGATLGIVAILLVRLLRYRSLEANR